MIAVLTMLPFLENDVGGQHDEGETQDVVPAQGLVQIEDGEEREDRQGDDLLDGLQFRRVEVAVTDAVGRDLQHVLEKGDAPADEDDHGQGHALVLQVTVPGEGHEDIGEHQQADCGDRDGDLHDRLLGADKEKTPMFPQALKFLEPLTRIELVTSSLPRMHSTD